MAVAVETQESFSYETPEAVLDGSSLLSEFATYHVSRDGSRFLIVKRSDPRRNWARTVMVQNWFQELTERVPIP